MSTFQERADCLHLAAVLQWEAAEQIDKPLPSSASLGCFDLQYSPLLILKISHASAVSRDTIRKLRTPTPMDFKFRLKSCGLLKSVYLSLIHIVDIEVNMVRANRV